MRACALCAVLSCAFLSSAGCGRRPSPSGASAPSARLALLQAPQTVLSDWSGLRGKVVVLEFWATWCDACLEAAPHMNRVAARFKDKPVQFISITDEDEGDVRAFLDGHPLSGWVALDPERRSFEGFGVNGLPHVVVLDPQGRVAGHTYPELVTPELIEGVLRGGGRS